MTIAVGQEQWGTQTRFRARRFALFMGLVEQVIAARGHCRVLDLGGHVQYWDDLAPLWRSQSLRLTLVNLSAEASTDPRIESLAGDACALPQFADNSFDIVHSNSVIEHVGGWSAMKAMAGEVRRLAPHYFVQTPNYWFPLEAHFRTPFFNWLPEPWRVSMLMRKGRGAFPKAETLDDAMRFVEDSRLLDARQMRALFPDAALQRERVFGFTKSLIAIR